MYHHADDGIVISLRGRVIPNHGLVTTQDVGVDSTRTNLSIGLLCNTTYDECCTSNNAASWYHGHFAGMVETSNQFAFGMSKTKQSLNLFRNKVLDDPTATNGIWRCIIPDQNGDQQTKYIGIYARGTTGQLTL